MKVYDIICESIPVTSGSFCCSAGSWGEGGGSYEKLDRTLLTYEKVGKSRKGILNSLELTYDKTNDNIRVT